MKRKIIGILSVCAMALTFFAVDKITTVVHAEENGHTKKQRKHHRCRRQQTQEKAASVEGLRLGVYHLHRRCPLLLSLGTGPFSLKNRCIRCAFGGWPPSGGRLLCPCRFCPGSRAGAFGNGSISGPGSGLFRSGSSTGLPTSGSSTGFPASGSSAGACWLSAGGRPCSFFGIHPITPLPFGSPAGQ